MKNTFGCSAAMLAGALIAWNTASAQQQDRSQPGARQGQERREQGDRLNRESVSAEQVSRLIENWKQKPREVAQTMIQKYGPPQEATSQRLIWHDNGPWKRSEIINEEIPHDFPMPHKDVLEQTINFKVPADKFDELAEYDGSVMVERTRGEISARCDKEAANFLAINLAAEIISGKRTAEEAKKEYAQQVMAMKNKQPTRYTQALMVKPLPPQQAGDPGEPVAVGGAAQSQKGAKNPQPKSN